MQLEPHYTYNIKIEIKPCKVLKLHNNNQKIEDVQISVGVNVELPFVLFEQEPACMYKANYTASTYLKDDSVTGILPYVKDLDGIVEGKPELVTIDMERNVI